MGNLARRLIFLTALSAGLAGSSTVQAWFEKRRGPKEPEPPALGLELERQAQAYQSKMAEFNKNLEELPPEQRALFLDAMAATRGEMKGNPLVMQLSNLSLSKRSSDAPDEAGLERAQKLYLLWHRAETTAIYLLWLTAGAVVLFGLGGALFGGENALRAVKGIGIGASHYWLFWLSIGAAVVFNMSRTNPWRQMPASFYAAPAVMMFADLLLRLGDGDAAVVLNEILTAAAAPAACLAAVALLGLAGP